MSWLDYRLHDFLLFAPDTYWRLFEQANQAVWPLPLAFPLLFAICLVAYWRFRQTVPYLAVGTLGMAWAWCGGFFVDRWYVQINWLASYAVPAFYLQALLIVGFGIIWVRSQELTFSTRRRVAGLILVLGASLLYPLAAFTRGQGFMGGEFVGTATDPTAVATLGFGLMARGRLTVICLPIPLAVCVTSFLTLWAMGSWQAAIPLAVIATILISLWPPSEPSTGAWAADR